MKRLFDIFIVIFLSVILSPVLLVVYILVKIDGGPGFFLQKRIGLNGTVFSLYKFRSMVVNAESLGGHSTKPNDNRITHIGNFIRKTSLDELPQLLNVFKGDMSLVGPRPNVPAQRSEYSEIQWVKRNSVLPGITGLAQATVRSNATWQERTDLDMEYVDRNGFFFDIFILFLTVKQVFLKGGY